MDINFYLDRNILELIGFLVVCLAVFIMAIGFIYLCIKISKD